MQRLIVRALPFLASYALLVACSNGSKTSSDSTRSSAKPIAQAVQAPPVFRVQFETSRGNFLVEAHRSWAPRGVDRFYQLVQSSFFDNTRFFRVVTGFMVQFGLSGEPEVNKAWEKLNIQDDSVTQSNKRGYVSFAAESAPNTRATQLFINLVDNHNLDEMGFAPIAQVVDGMAVVDSLYAGYGEGAPQGFGPDQMRIMSEGNTYLERDFPKLDFIRTAKLVALPTDAATGGDSAAKKGAAR
jgi:peptidyl-prolyl cis-trans isomerase A (cyclophilin A)